MYEDAFSSMVIWVRSHGGYVHKHICAKEQETICCSYQTKNGSQTDDNDSFSQFVNRGLYAAKASTADDCIASSDNEPKQANEEDVLIFKGELLIRISERLVLSGKSLPDKIEDPSQEHSRYISPWLRCLSKLILTKNEKDSFNDQKRLAVKKDQKKSGTERIETDCYKNFFDPYFKSLPKSFDTLLSWNGDEVNDLEGTMLGYQIQHEKRSNALKNNFESNCLPIIQHFLNNLQLVPQKSTAKTKNQQKTNDFESIDVDSKSEQNVNYNGNISFEEFLWATQVISTRGFHMQSAISSLTDLQSDGNEKSCTSWMAQSEGGIEVSNLKDDSRSTKYSNCDSRLEGNVNEREEYKKLSINDKKSSLYNGPYLLPVIDMLNHEPCSLKRCTSLRYDPKDGSFYMIAERDIKTNEEILHSYGNDMTSAQLLQTFGFVHKESSERMANWTLTEEAMNKCGNLPRSSDLLNSHCNRDSQMDTRTNPNPFHNMHITPATLSRDLLIKSCWEEASRRGSALNSTSSCDNKHLKPAAAATSRKRMRDSEINHEGQSKSKTTSQINEEADEEEYDEISSEEEEVWDPRDCWDEKKKYISVSSGSNNDDDDDELIPDQIIVQYGNNPMNEHLITCCAVMLLPKDAFEDFVGSSPSLLDESVLDDTYLGMMICNSLQECIQRKLLLYKSTFENDQEQLRYHLQQEENGSITTKGRRQIYALTVRLEERVSLQSLTQHILEVQADLMTE